MKGANTMVELTVNNSKMDFFCQELTLESWTGLLDGMDGSPGGVNYRAPMVLRSLKIFQWKYNFF